MAKIHDDVFRMLDSMIESTEKTKPDTTYFRGSPEYRYYSGGQNAKGQRVRFCYTEKPNVAGYYLYFREVVMQRKVKRYKGKHFKTAARASTEAMRQCRKWQDRKKAQSAATS